MATVQGDILEHECSLTDMKLSAALGWLVCQWLLLTALNTKHTSEHQKYLLAASKHPRRQASFQASSLLDHYAASSGTFSPTFPDTLRSALFRILEH